MNDVRLLQGDCLVVMPEMEPGSIDLILADLPYGTTACKWDSVIPFEPLWAEYRRLLKPRGAVVLTASQPFTSMLVMSNREWFKYEIVWEKSKATGHLDARRRPMKAHESILVFCDGEPEYVPQISDGNPYRGRPGKKITEVYGAVRDPSMRNDNDGFRYPRSVVYFKTSESEGQVFHPTQKPVALMEYLIRTYSNEGDTVLDNTMGSGTTGVACVQTSRNFIGIELDAGYFAVAEVRIADARLRLERPHAPVQRPQTKEASSPLFDLWETSS